MHANFTQDAFCNFNMHHEEEKNVFWYNAHQRGLQIAGESPKPFAREGGTT